MSIELLMRRLDTASRRQLGAITALLILSGYASSIAAQPVGQDEVAELKQMLLRQQSIIEDQEKRLREQGKMLQKLADRLETSTSVSANGIPAGDKLPIATPKASNAGSVTDGKKIAMKTVPAASIATSPATTKAPGAHDSDMQGKAQITQVEQNPRERQRDSVGDLNAGSIKAGTFPGSIQIPGPGNVSIAVGGFAKTALIVDTNQEASGADFLPALLGTVNNDSAGNTSIDASLTRFNLDTRAPTELGDLRAYVEFDLNKNNNGSLDPKLRHAYGSWKNPWGKLTAGQTWTTFMDTGILPESVTEPTVSGVIFQRQPLIRWSQNVTSKAVFDFALEDPNSNDVFSQQRELGRSPSPDVIGALEVAEPGTGHLRLASIYRRIELTRAVGNNPGQNGWGVSAGGHLDAFAKDRVMLGGTYGSGIGRYLLGIAPSAGGVLDPTTDELQLRDNFGGMAGYQRFWTETLRSSFAYGYAQAATLSGQPDEAFKSTMYAYTNLLWSVLPYLTFGLEYDYGLRKNRDGGTLDNSRFMVGVQLF